MLHKVVTRDWCRDVAASRCTLGYRRAATCARRSARAPRSPRPLRTASAGARDLPDITLITPGPTFVRFNHYSISIS